MYCIAIPLHGWAAHGCTRPRVKVRYQAFQLQLGGLDIEKNTPWEHIYIHWAGSSNQQRRSVPGFPRESSKASWPGVSKKVLGTELGAISLEAIASRLVAIASSRLEEAIVHWLVAIASRLVEWLVGHGLVGNAANGGVVGCTGGSQHVTTHPAPISQDLKNSRLKKSSLLSLVS